MDGCDGFRLFEHALATHVCLAFCKDLERSDEHF